MISWLQGARVYAHNLSCALLLTLYLLCNSHDNHNKYDVYLNFSYGSRV